MRGDGLGRVRAMASEMAALRARVKSLESENGKLASALRKQESASRTMTESLQSELARIQHLCQANFRFHCCQYYRCCGYRR